MTTFESRYEERIRSLCGKRCDRGGVSEEEVEYMLAAAPFIRQYSQETRCAVKPAPPPHKRRAIDDFVVVSTKSNKNMVFQQYLVEVEKNMDAARALPREASSEDTYTCAECDTPLLINSRESDLVCPGCGVIKRFMGNSDQNVTYEQQVQQYTPGNYFAYKRLNHFTEWLNSLQAKENTDIPQEVLDAVRAEFKKERASKRCDIKAPKVRAFLKKLKLHKYYEHAVNICTLLNGMPAPKLPQFLEDRLKKMFGEIQEPFQKHCPPWRKNFLSYSYVLYKFCELLGEDTYLEYFQLLKSPEKLHQQDSIWKNICKELGWEFIRSV